MFEFLKKLFKKSVPVKAGETVNINISGNNITLNGNKLVLPTEIDNVTAILGNPRAQQYDTKVSDKQFLDSMYKNNSVTNRVNFMWDDLGIKCYTLNGKTVTTFSVELNKGSLNYPNTTRDLFKGNVTINGKPWLDTVKTGQDLEVIQQLRLGKYTITCEYTDFEAEASKRTEKDYTGIEVSIAK